MKRFLMVLMAAAVFLLLAATAFAGISGILGAVKDAVTSPVQATIFGAIGVVLAFILKRIPNEKIQAVVGGLGHGLGVTITLGLSKWSYTKSLWNKTVEPYVIDLIYNIPIWFFKSMIEGMKTDNE